MPVFLCGVAGAALRAAAIAIVGVLVRELVFMMDPRGGSRPYNDHWFEEE